MAALGIRDLDDEVRGKSRVRAARQGRSMDAEVRCIFAAAVEEPTAGGALSRRRVRRPSAVAAAPGHDP